MRVLMFLAAVLVSSSLVSAQQIQTVRVLDPTTKANVDVGDAVNAAIAVSSGGASLLTQTTGAAMAQDMADLLAIFETGLAIDAVHDEPIADSTGPPLMAEFDDTTPDSVDEADAGRLRISANRNLYMTLRDGTGSERGASVNASNQLSVIDANSAASLAAMVLLTFADESAFTYATSRVQPLGAVAEATIDTLTDGQIGAPAMTLARALRTTATGYGTGGGSPVAMRTNNTNDDDIFPICTAACTIYSISAFNHSAAPAFLRCERDTVGNTIPGMEGDGNQEPYLMIPGSTTGAGFHLTFPVGISYATALTCWIATGEAITDTTDAGDQDVTVFFSLVQ